MGDVIEPRSTELEIIILDANCLCLYSVRSIPIEIHSLVRIRLPVCSIREKAPFCVAPLGGRITARTQTRVPRRSRVEEPTASAPFVVKRERRARKTSEPPNE